MVLFTEQKVDHENRPQIFMGRFIFNSIYIPFIYEPILRINMIKQQLQNEIDYNKSFVPDYWAIPY